MCVQWKSELLDITNTIASSEGVNAHYDEHTGKMVKIL